MVSQLQAPSAQLRFGQCECAWDPGRIPVCNAPIQQFPWAGVDQLIAGLLAEGAQGSQEQRRGLVRRQRRSAIVFAQLVTVRLDDQRYVQIARLAQAQ